MPLCTKSHFHFPVEILQSGVQRLLESFALPTGCSKQRRVRKPGYSALTCLQEMGEASLPIELLELTNRPKVLCQPDKRTPMAVVRLCLRAGSKHESPGRRGVAHLCEHLVWQGDNRASGSFLELFMVRVDLQTAGYFTIKPALLTRFPAASFHLSCGSRPNACPGMPAASHRNGFRESARP